MFVVFQKLDFKFPLTVSCVHFICSSIGAYVMIKILKVKPLISVEPEDRWRRIFPMSFVFCINIVLGNVSLRYIPVSFMQTIKSFTPATTVILQWMVWRKYFDWRIWASLVPIVGGILLTSVTELSFNVFGFCAALFGCLATSTKTILAESLLHGYKFDRYRSLFIVCLYNNHFSVCYNIRKMNIVLSVVFKRKGIFMLTMMWPTCLSYLCFYVS
ncbi:putative sugar phosphate transporter domain-containing protein [Helianthus annuus]|nr:putative sugar phosphate transporter domain-containing protein [Helianthus annuus]